MTVQIPDELTFDFEGQDSVTIKLSEVKKITDRLRSELDVKFLRLVRLLTMPELCNPAKKLLCLEVSLHDQPDQFFDPITGEKLNIKRWRSSPAFPISWVICDCVPEL